MARRTEMEFRETLRNELHQQENEIAERHREKVARDKKDSNKREL